MLIEEAFNIVRHCRIRHVCMVRRGSMVPQVLMQMYIVDD